MVSGQCVIILHYMTNLGCSVTSTKSDLLCVMMNTYLPSHSLQFTMLQYLISNNVLLLLTNVQSVRPVYADFITVELFHVYISF